MPPRIFTALPEDLSALSVEQLQEHIAERQTLAAKVMAEDHEVVPADKFTAEDVLFELAAAAEQIEKLQTELASRGEAVEEYERQKAELAAKIGAPVALAQEDDEQPEQAADAEEAAAGAEETLEESAETVEESTEASLKAVRRPSLPAPEPEREPVVVEAEQEIEPAGLVASADIPKHANFMPDGARAGQKLDRMGFAKAALATASRISPTATAPRVEVVVASATWNAPEERKLRANDPEGNADKILAVVPAGRDREALLADGGLCAPLTPLYDLPQISSEDRPVRDSLPAFQADRGGITWAVPPSIADVTDAVGIVTAEEDGEGGTFATKTCQFLDCQDFLSAEIAAIFHCLEWGNIGARAWPERVAQFSDVVMAAWSRLAEVNLLNLMKAGSTQVTAAAATYGYGALSDFTSQVLAAAAGYRSRFRMANDSRFRVVGPAWLRDLILSDLINSQFDRFALQGYAGVDAFLRERQIDPVWTIDGETGGGQIFGAQGSGALLTFPDSVKWFLYPEGTWIWVSMGTLELGIVRDSTLNAQNDFQVFGEGFETIAQVGYQSLEVTSALCPSGATGGPATLLTC